MRRFGLWMVVGALLLVPAAAGQSGDEPDVAGVNVAYRARLYADQAIGSSTLVPFLGCFSHEYSLNVQAPPEGVPSRLPMATGTPVFGCHDSFLFEVPEASVLGGTIEARIVVSCTGPSFQWLGLSFQLLVDGQNRGFGYAPTALTGRFCGAGQVLVIKASLRLDGEISVEPGTVLEFVVRPDMLNAVEGDVHVAYLAGAKSFATSFKFHPEEPLDEPDAWTLDAGDRGDSSVVLSVEVKWAGAGAVGSVLAGSALLVLAARRRARRIQSDPVRQAMRTISDARSSRPGGT